MKEGTLVAVWRDNGEVFITTTSTDSYRLDKPMGAPEDYTLSEVIHLHGVSGFYAMSHIRPITINNIHSSAIFPLGAAIMGEG